MFMDVIMCCGSKFVQFEKGLVSSVSKLLNFYVLCLVAWMLIQDMNIWTLCTQVEQSVVLYILWCILSDCLSVFIVLWPASWRFEDGECQTDMLGQNSEAQFDQRQSQVEPTSYL